MSHDHRHAYTRRTAIERCALTDAGLRQERRYGGSALEVAHYPGEIIVTASDTMLGSSAIQLHPDDAEHFMERLRVSIAIARSLEAEASPESAIKLSADGDRLLDQPAAA